MWHQLALCLLLTFVCIFAALTLTAGEEPLDCDFDGLSFCNWINSVNGIEDDFDWKIGNQLSIDGFHSIPRTLTGVGSFAYAQGQLRPEPLESARAWLHSLVIDTLSVPAILSFIYWKAAAPPILQICTRDAGASQLRCLDTISNLGQQAWVRRSVIIPANPNQFQIVIAASGFRTALDTLAVDDITITSAGSNDNVGFNGLDGTSDGTHQTQNVSMLYRTTTEIPAIQPPPSVDEANAGSQGSNVTQTYNGGFIPSIEITTKSPFEMQQELFANQSSFQSNFGGFKSGANASEIINDNNNGDLNNDLSDGGGNVLAVQRRIESQKNAARFFKSRLSATSNGGRKANVSTINAMTAYRLNAQLPQQRGQLATLNRNFITAPPLQFPFAAASPATSTISSADSAACTPIGCTFDRDLCNWYNNLNANFDWRLKNAVSSFPGISGDSSNRSSYIYVSGERRNTNQRASLSSNRFYNRNGGGFLELFVYMSEATSGQLSVFRDEVFDSEHIVWLTVGNRYVGAGWQRIRIPLPVTDALISLTIVGDMLAGNGFIGVDDIHLVDAAGRELACESLPVGADNTVTKEQFPAKRNSSPWAQSPKNSSFSSSINGLQFPVISIPQPSPFNPTRFDSPLTQLSQQSQLQFLPAAQSANRFASPPWAIYPVILPNYAAQLQNFRTQAFRK